MPRLRHKPRHQIERIPPIQASVDMGPRGLASLGNRCIVMLARGEIQGKRREKGDSALEAISQMQVVCRRLCNKAERNGTEGHVPPFQQGLDGVPFSPM